MLADANGGWSLCAALVAAQCLADLPVRLERPCRTMSDCVQLRRTTHLPIVLDEVVLTLEDLAYGKQFVGARGLDIKPSRIGGLTKARLLRDATQALGKTFTVDDTWGGSLVTAQIAAVAANASAGHLKAVTSFATLTDRPSASVPTRSSTASRSCQTAPSLELEIDASLLGDAILDTVRQR
ncbi:MAG: hypothetical protein M3Y71_02545 [Actinomycetota bacterium]|nr:hypothetical protein [Actinomycetota bacterium]